MTYAVPCHTCTGQGVAGGADVVCMGLVCAGSHWLCGMHGKNDVHLKHHIAAGLPLPRLACTPPILLPLPCRVLAGSAPPDVLASHPQLRTRLYDFVRDTLTYLQPVAELRRDLFWESSVVRDGCFLLLFAATLL